MRKFLLLPLSLLSLAGCVVHTPEPVRTSYVVPPPTTTYVAPAPTVTYPTTTYVAPVAPATTTVIP
jgi:uncharacterized protein YcfL